MPPFANQETVIVDPTSLRPAPFEDRYETRKQLWLDGPHGGWLAFDRVLGRDVVLNIPYRPDDNRRFISAAQLRARLRHANLIPLFDFNVTREGKPYFTDPYLQTLDLCEFLRRGSDDILWAGGRLLVQVCAALGFLHAYELLHLDLKPQNVLVTQPFEEAFLIRGHPSLPAADITPENNKLLGGRCFTPAYAAPEQADEFGVTTTRTDVYGLGGLLYFILYDDAPNRGQPSATRDILDIIRSLTQRDGPPAPGFLRCHDSPSRKLAGRLEPIWQRALQSDPVRRQGTVIEFSKELIGALMR